MVLLQSYSIQIDLSYVVCRAINGLHCVVDTRTPKNERYTHGAPSAPGGGPRWSGPSMHARSELSLIHAALLLHLRPAAGKETTREPPRRDRQQAANGRIGSGSAFRFSSTRRRPGGEKLRAVSQSQAGRRAAPRHGVGVGRGVHIRTEYSHYSVCRAGAAQLAEC
jgi:hypothetical protein